MPAAFKEHYPFASHELTLNGLRYHYLDEGAGEPVVMVHGNPTWSFYYRRLVLELRGSYRTIVPDHIGCGLSEKPGDRNYAYTLCQRIDDLDALLSHLELDDNVTLVLHDWGGLIGLGWAVRHRHKIKRLVLLNTAAFHLPRSKRFPWLLWLVRTPLGSFLVRGLNAFCRIAARVCVTRAPLPKDIRDAYCVPYDSWSNRIAILRFVQDIPLKPTDRAYDRVTEVQNSLGAFGNIPVMICWGERDFVFDQTFLDQWQRILPQAQVHRFADSGHYVLEDAADEIIALVENFLQSHPVVSTPMPLAKTS